MENISQTSFYAQSEELNEWKSALPGESEMYIFDAPGTPKFLSCMFFFVILDLPLY